MPAPKMEPSPERAFERGGVQSVEVGMRLLLALANGGGELTLGRIAELADMPPAKAHRYLASMIRSGFVERSEPGNRYALGGAALRMGLAAVARLDVIKVAETEMRELRDHIEAALLLAVWGSNGPTIVRWIESPRPVTVNVRVGSTMPLLRSATGRVFAAFLPDAVIRPYIAAETEELRETGALPLGEQELEAQLDSVRKGGLGHTAGEMLPGVLALAAPIFDHDNELAGVVAALGPRGFFDDRTDGHTACELIKTAGRMSRKLGAPPK